jgi:hypothetical protein
MRVEKPLAWLSAKRNTSELLYLLNRCTDGERHNEKKYMVEIDEQEQLHCNHINKMLQSAGNPMFSSDMRYQTPIILDLGTNKSITLTLQAYQVHTYFPKILKLGKTYQLEIIGIGHVGGLTNVLQPADPQTPALLSVSNYLDVWPESVITVNASKAIIYESTRIINEQPTSKIMESLSSLTIIAEFTQIGNIYVAPNFTFLYDRPTSSSPLIKLPILNDLDQKSILE